MQNGQKFIWCIANLCLCLCFSKKV